MPKGRAEGRGPTLGYRLPHTHTHLLASAYALVHARSADSVVRHPPRPARLRPWLHSRAGARAQPRPRPPLPLFSHILALTPALAPLGLSIALILHLPQVRMREWCHASRKPLQARDSRWVSVTEPSERAV